MIVDLFLVYSFIKRLATPFDEWPAFKLGIIDADGNQLKKKKDLKTVEERAAFGVYDLMILKLKKLLANVPGGQSRIASYAAALWLIKEHEEIESHGELMTEEDIESKFNQYLHYTTESMDVNRKFEIMIEDGVAVNNAGGGAVAGIGVGPHGEPGVSKAAQKKIQKKNRVMSRL
jgi:hypothetical protein